MSIEPEAQPDRFNPSLFVVILIFATILYFATNGSVLIAVLPCLYAGWKTFRAGLWILKSDPYRTRARICCTFYFAAAVWKIAADAFLTAMIFGIAENCLGFQPKIESFAAITITLLGGIVLNTLIGLIAIFAAIHYKIRVWIQPHIRTILHDDLRYASILKLHYYGFNHAIFVVGTALLFPIVIFTVICFALLTTGQNANHVPTESELIIGMSILFGGPIAMIACYIWLSSRIIARNPQECWPIESFLNSEELSSG
jgi:hypothetical protein